MMMMMMMMMSPMFESLVMLSVNSQLVSLSPVGGFKKCLCSFQLVIIILFHRFTVSPFSAFTVKRPQPGSPEDFQPIRNLSFNKEMNVQTSRETLLFLDWLLSILNFRRLKWLTFSVSQSETKEFWLFM